MKIIFASECIWYMWDVFWKLYWFFAISIQYLFMKTKKGSANIFFSSGVQCKLLRHAEDSVHGNLWFSFHKLVMEFYYTDTFQIRTPLYMESNFFKRSKNRHTSLFCWVRPSVLLLQVKVVSITAVLPARPKRSRLGMRSRFLVYFDFG
jgi:hypothetical protein